ncbi:stage III sporulation protein AH [Pontibacillus yanchengensis Y32]|uniref:Stage III sporulation protein AH n=2 Tax=Pontibacillus yanchengensis TaxID=462910 RepID=A0A0A2TBL4_9BACI|nr:SpoIIIAH-like family protein [Pontibacillus yanchengensis]KGP72924.1 stage III sporulation protein AH [Pontibacillus yanchengensis Y32]
MLKKQTVWLLTMLSLMIVLSVYYMTSPSEDQVALLYDEEEKNEEQASTEENTTEETNPEGTMSEDGVVETKGEEKGNVTSSVTSDEIFTAMRMQIEDSRSKTKEELKDIMASGQMSASEVESVVSEIRQLEELSTKEKLLEQSIQAKAEYPDVLVRAEENKVFVTVKANELSSSETVQIMDMVQEEFGKRTVDVEFQPYAQ